MGPAGAVAVAAGAAAGAAGAAEGLHHVHATSLPRKPKLAPPCDLIGG